MKKVLLNIIVGIWLVIAILTTISLLSVNEYRITELGKYSFVSIDSKDLELNYKKGSLLIIEKTPNDSINSNDDIFYYNSNNKDAIVNYGTVSTKTVLDENQTTFVMQGQQSISSDYVIGKADTTKVINNIGYLITILQSKWGFMFIVIFPSIFLVIYEIYNIVSEIRNKDEE